MVLEWTLGPGAAIAGVCGASAKSTPTIVPHAATPLTLPLMSDNIPQPRLESRWTPMVKPLGRGGRQSDNETVLTAPFGDPMLGSV
jgi:hypothetical protein